MQWPSWFWRIGGERMQLTPMPGVAQRRMAPGNFRQLPTPPPHPVRSSHHRQSRKAGITLARMQQAEQPFRKTPSVTVEQAEGMSQQPDKYRRLVSQSRTNGKPLQRR